MDYPLAVLTPRIGVRSETFVRRHALDLLPGKTVLVSREVPKAASGDWCVTSPVLCLSPNGPLKRFLRRLPNSTGWSAARNQRRVKAFLKDNRVKVILGEYLDFSYPFMATAVELLTTLGISKDKIHVVPCGVDVPPSPLEREDSHVVRCFAVGRMVAKKGPLITLEAFRKAAIVMPNLRLDFIGGGDLFGQAQDFVRKHDLAGKVLLHGAKPNKDVLALMRECGIFLQHSITDPLTGDEEGLPVGILEAMANALPVVSTRHAGIPEAVLDGSTGHLVPEGDAGAMADRIIALTKDARLRRAFGSAGWERARNLFSWEVEKAALLRITGLTSCAK